MKIHHDEPYAPLRKAAYPPVGEQLDALMKFAARLQDAGIELPPETRLWVQQCQDVKARFQKS